MQIANDSPSMSVCPLPLFQGPMEAPGMPQCPDVTADKQDLGPGSQGPLFTVWCPRSVQGPSDLVGGLCGYGWGSCKNCEAGGRRHK